MTDNPSSQPDAVHTRDEGPEWLAWSWSSRRRRFPWLGVLLVLVGVGLLIQYFEPRVSVGTILILALGLAFLAGWLFGGSSFSMIAGVLVVALAVAPLAREMGIYDGPGLTALSLAAGFVIVWLAGWSRHRGYTWALWAAAILGLIGAVQLSGRLTDVPALGALGPVIVIAIGLLLVVAAQRRSI